MAPAKAGVGKPPAGLGLGMLNLSAKVRLGKFYLSSKDCHNVKVFSLGPLTLSCAQFLDAFNMLVNEQINVF